MRLTQSTALILLCAILLAGCTTSTPGAATQAPTMGGDPMPTAVTVSLPVVEFEGIRFSYDATLASEIIPEFIPTRFGDQFAPWDQTPNHVAFTFRDPYTEGRDLYWQGFSPDPVPKIFIYRTVDFPEEVLGWDGKAQILALQNMLQERKPDSGGTIPVLPLTNAGQTFHAKLAYMDFDGGSGVRFVTQYTQEPRAINNQELIYTFQGMTSDGAYYISGILPVSAEHLPAKFEIKEEEIPNFQVRWGKYLEETTQKINHFPDGAFDPNLETLDAIFLSLSFPFVDPTPTPQYLAGTPEPTEFVEEVPSFIYPTPLPTLSAQYVEYRSEAFQVAFQVPEHWERMGEDHYQGEDGFFQITPYDSPASGLEDVYTASSTRIFRACAWELNAEPTRYGAVPVVIISGYYGDSRCIIFPGEGAADPYGTLIFDTAGGSLAVLRADLRQMQMIGDTFYYVDGYTPLHKERPYAGQEVQPSLEMVGGGPRQTGDLTLEEYALFRADWQTPGEDLFPGALGTAADMRRAWREGGVPLDGPQRLAHDNQVLEQFGYSLVSEGDRMNLYQGQEALQENVIFSHLPMVTSGGEVPGDFALVLGNADGTEHWLLRMEGLSSWEMSKHMFIAPAFVGGKLAAVEMEEAGLYSRLWVTVEGDREALFLYPFAYPLFLAIHGWGDQWVMEVDGTLVLDGQILNLERDYGEAFGWSLLGGKPFFFFEKDGKYGISYDGEDLPLEYDAILHTTTTSSPLDPKVNEHMAWFYGIRDGMWYYVEVGRYE